MSSAPTPATSTAPARIAETVKKIGELHLQLAAQIEALSAMPLDRAPSSLRAELVELVRSVLTDLGLLSAPDHDDGDGAGTGTDTPSTDTPTTDTPDNEDPMSLLFRDFGYAHLRLAMKGDDIVVERASGFERVAYPATRAPDIACHPDGAAVVTARPEPLELPRNTRLVRLRLSADHQIDPNDAVIVATPADRETAYRYEMTAFGVDDRTIDVAVRAVDPDTNAPLTIARVNVLVFRVA